MKSPTGLGWVRATFVASNLDVSFQQRDPKLPEPPLRLWRSQGERARESRKSPRETAGRRAKVSRAPKSGKTSVLLRFLAQPRPLVRALQSLLVGGDSRRRRTRSGLSTGAPSASGDASYTLSRARVGGFPTPSPCPLPRGEGFEAKLRFQRELTRLPLYLPLLRRPPAVGPCRSSPARLAPAALPGLRCSD